MTVLLLESDWELFEVTPIEELVFLKDFFNDVYSTSPEMELKTIVNQLKPLGFKPKLIIKAWRNDSFGFFRDYVNDRRRIWD